jgi:hypothetical protein
VSYNRFKNVLKNKVMVRVKFLDYSTKNSVSKDIKYLSLRFGDSILAVVDTVIWFLSGRLGPMMSQQCLLLAFLRQITSRIFGFFSKKFVSLLLEISGIDDKRDLFGPSVSENFTDTKASRRFPRIYLT